MPSVRWREGERLAQKGYVVDKTLTEQIQELIDALQIAASQAAKVKRRLREQRISFGLDLNHVDDDIAHLVARVKHLKHLAERREEADRDGEREVPAAT